MNSKLYTKDYYKKELCNYLLNENMINENMINENMINKNYQNDIIKKITFRKDEDKNLLYSKVYNYHDTHFDFIYKLSSEIEKCKELYKNN